MHEKYLNEEFYLQVLVQAQVVVVALQVHLVLYHSTDATLHFHGVHLLHTAA